VAEDFAADMAARLVRRRALARLGVAVAAISIVGAALQAAAPVLRSAGLAPAARPYVALWFPHPSVLPAHLGPGGRLAFSFEVGNYTGSAVKQRWVVTALDGRGRARAVRSGWTGVPAGGESRVPVSMTLPQGVAQVEVALPGRHLSPIEFHLANPPHASPGKVAPTRSRLLSAHRARQGGVPG